MLQKNKEYAYLCLIVLFFFITTQFVDSAERKAQGKKAESQKIVLDFRNADIKTLVKFIAKLQHLIVVFEGDISGEVSIFPPKPLTLSEAYRVIIAFLDAEGYTLIRSKNLLKVVKKKGAIQRPIKTFYGSDPRLVPSTDEVITQIVPIKNVMAIQILNTVNSLISPTGEAFDNKETNTLILSDTASNIRRILGIIRYLDVKKPLKTKEITNVYSIKYMKAKDMAQALGKVFGGQTAGEEKFQVKITPVPAVNALVVTADRGLQKQISDTIKKLDIRRKQVLIEVKIVEATLSKDFEAAVNLTKYLFSGAGAEHTIKMGRAVTNSFISYTVKSARVDATLEMLAKKDLIHILSSPEILTSDNQKAKIVVGQEQPILKSVTNLGTEGGEGKTVSDYVYKDVGIELEVTPHINVDRDVAMDIKFKITSILSEVPFPGNVKVPLVGKRQASTNVVVMDGNTLVIGGLIKNSHRNERQKVPLLGDIPILGLLFSWVHKVSERTELMLFITPHVVASSKEGSNLTKSQSKKRGKEFKKMLQQGQKGKRKIDGNIKKQ